MQKYPTYKTSNIDWIGEIPSHWKVKKLKYFAQIMNGKDYQEFVLEEGGYPVFGTGGIFARCSKFLHNKPSVLLGRKGSVSNPQFVTEPFWTSDTTYYTDIKNDVEPMFLFHLVKQIQFDLYIYGSAIPSMTKSVYDDMLFPCPPLTEQQSIVAYLDEKTALIDELMAKKESKIALLKEQRAALINQAVTKGLNLNVKMKDSKIEWIGVVPEHWKYIPLKYVTLTERGIQTGPFGTQLNTKDYVDSGVKVLNQKTLIDEDYSLGEEYITLEKNKELKGFEVNSGDIILGTRGSFGTKNRTTFGKCSIVPNDIGECVLHPCLIRIRLDEVLITKEFFKYFVNESTYFLDEIVHTSNSTTIEVIYGVTLKDIKFPLPPLSEQQAIVAYLDEETSLIDKNIEIEQQKISTLKEYRQSLISNVVTGKVKVSPVAPDGGAF